MLLAVFNILLAIVDAPEKMTESQQMAETTVQQALGEACSKSIVIIEDHPLVLSSLSQLAMQAVPAAAIHHAKNFQQAQHLATSGMAVDLVLLDPGLPDVHGKPAISALRQLFANAILIVISANDLHFDVHSALDSGADAFISKGSQPEDILKALSNAAAGAVPLLTHWQKSMSISLGDPTSFRLSERQIAVLQAIAQGYSNKEIARLLNISENTVKVHITAVFERMGVTNRTQATLAARRAGYAS